MLYMWQNAKKADDKVTLHIANAEGRAMCKAFSKKPRPAVFDNSDTIKPAHSRICGTCKHMAECVERAKNYKPPEKKAPARKVLPFPVPKPDTDAHKEWATSPDFLGSYQWRELRMKVIKAYGAVCMCCGASPKSGAVICVDHIKPRKRRPDLALEFSNLQVLCEECNHGKGNWDETDWRPVQHEIEPDEQAHLDEITRAE